MLRARDALVAARTEIINTIRGLVKSMGTRLPSVPAGASHTRERRRLRWRCAKRCCPWCVWQQP
jgi:hypothetical protein